MKSLNRILAHLCSLLWERFIRTFQERTLISFIIVTVTIIGSTSVLLRVIEHDEETSIWRAVVFIVSGFDVEPPATALGRVVGALVVCSGVVLVSLLTAFLASEFSRAVVTTNSIKEKPGNELFEEHVVILGWGPKRKEILRQLNRTWEEAGMAADDIVIIANDEHLEKSDEYIYKHVWHVRGDPSDVESLRRADFVPGVGKGAKVVAILGDFSATAEENDRNVLLQLLAAEHMHPAVVSLAEVQDVENLEHYRNANVDEAILPNEIANLVLARTAEQKGLASYFDELLSLVPPEDESDVRQQRYPVSFYTHTAKELGIGAMSFDAAVPIVYERTEQLLVGILERDRILLLPELGERTHAPLSDEMIMLVIDRPR